MKKVFSSGTESGFFSPEDEDNSGIKERILYGIMQGNVSNKYDQYTHYIYRSGLTASDYFFARIKRLISSEKSDWIFFYSFSSLGLYLIGTRLSKWDEDHFGFKMANLQIFIIPDGAGKEPDILRDLLNKALSYLKNKNVAFVSSRVNGDNIVALHSMEDAGFRYYDNVIWPITDAKTKPGETEVRLIEDKDIDEVKRIAGRFQYPRGHYYCDERFDKTKVDAMYSKWVDTTLKNKEHIAVIESSGKLAGLFVFKMDAELAEHTGYRYGRLRLLALDSQFRGLGLGEKLFKGTLSLISGLGADYIDSGYSTKNHVSARLHVKTSFYSVYEEVTFHLWLK